MSKFPAHLGGVSVTAARKAGITDGFTETTMPKADQTTTPTTAQATSGEPTAQQNTGEPNTHQQAGFSQADVDRIVADRLSRERDKYTDYSELKAKADKLDEQEAANQTEVERLAKQLDKITGERDQMAAEKLRREAIDKAGLDAQWAKFVTGTTAEEAEASAQELAELAGTKQEPKQEPEQTPGQTPAPHGYRGGGVHKPGVTAGRDLYRDTHSSKG